MHAGIGSRPWDASRSWTRVTPTLARSLARRWRPSGPRGGGSVDPNVYWALANYLRALRELVRFGTVVYFGGSMTSAQRELTYLTFRAEVDLQTGEALALACPFACPDVLGG
jgi:hypothetical protein